MSSRRRNAASVSGFSEVWKPEGLARLTASERDGLWAHNILETYLRGGMIRTKGISLRSYLPYDRRQMIWALTNGRCVYCGKATEPFVDFTVDHFVPLAVGGIDAVPNLLPCCVACNSAKADRTVEEWFRVLNNSAWLIDRALDYYRAAIFFAKVEYVTFTGVPLWLSSGLVTIPDPSPNGRKSRKEQLK